MRLSRTLKIDLVWALVGGLATLLMLYACQSCKPSTSPDAGSPDGGSDAALAAPIAITPIVDGTCTPLTGITQNETVIAICAFAEEVARVIDLITTLRRTAADGGRPILTYEALTCIPVPGDKLFCATPHEMGMGISAVLLARQARLTRDGGMR